MLAKKMEITSDSALQKYQHARAGVLTAAVGGHVNAMVRVVPKQDGYRVDVCKVWGRECGDRRRMSGVVAGASSGRAPMPSRKTSAPHSQLSSSPPDSSARKLTATPSCASPANERIRERQRVIGFGDRFQKYREKLLEAVVIGALLAGMTRVNQTFVDRMISPPWQILLWIILLVVAGWLT